MDGGIFLRFYILDFAIACDDLFACVCAIAVVCDEEEEEGGAHFGRTQKKSLILTKCPLRHM